MTYAIDEALVTKARELGPLIREHAAEAEKERRLSKRVIDALNQSGITKMLLPKSLGGLETDPVTMMRVVEEIATYDSVAGWLLMVSNSGAFTGSRFSAEVMEEIVADPNDWFVAGAFQPPVEAREVDGGYRLTGRRPLASFSHAARWIFLTAIVMDGEQPRMFQGMPVVVFAVMNAKDVEILDTWNALGMRGTDSTDVSVRDVFVPKAFVCPLAPQFEPNKHFRSPLFRMPMLAPLILGTVAPNAIAIAQNAISEVRALSSARVPMGSMVPLRDRGAAQARLGRADAMLRAARAFMYETMADAWARTLAGETFSIDQRATILSAAAHGAQVGAEVTDMMFVSGGSGGVFTRSPLERLFRDAQVIRQHGFVAASRYETVAQVRLGLEPDLPVIYF
jgi:alkylation response protein AidB-like acyl-CoA dehydrogenase